VEVRTVTLSNLEDEVSICVPPRDSPNYSKFEKGVREKIYWLQEKMKGYGYVGNLAYDSRGEPLGFIEFVPAEESPLPIEDLTDTALITCIYLPEMQGKGIGTRLLQAALKQLWKIGVSQVKTLVSRSSQWINSGIYLKHGFQLEKTFYRAGSSEPLDLLTLSIHGPQPKIKPTIQHMKVKQKDNLPIEVIYFHSPQCPFSSVVYSRHEKATAKFSADQVTFKVFDSWKQPELARKYGSFYSDTFINRRAPFFAPLKQEDIEREIQKELNRVLRLQSKG
jgi:GNAT superfamily N-acetyltransferase